MDHRLTGRIEVLPGRRYLFQKGLRYGLLVFQQMLLGGVLLFRDYENRILPNRRKRVFAVFQHKPTLVPVVGLDFAINAGQYLQVRICT